MSKNPAPKQSSSWKLLIIVAFAFLLYGNTISHNYALDDEVVITGNKFTKKGLGGMKEIFSHDTFTGFFGISAQLPGGRYRPLSVATFAFEHTVFGENPHASHFINILLYALTGVLIFRILTKLIPENKSTTLLKSIPLITALLFIAHPIHTEVVANIKGRDEIMSLLGVLFALWYSIKYIESEKVKYLFFVFISFFAATLSKENAITFVAIVPLTLYFFFDASFIKKIKVFVPILLAALIFMLLRGAALGTIAEYNSWDIMNNPFANASLSEKYASIFYTLGNYIKLLIFPHPLTYDYYPHHITIVGWSNPFVLLALAIHLLLLAFVIRYFMQQKIEGAFKIQKSEVNLKHVFSFCILYYFITLSVASNIFFNVGVAMAERFLYLPSLGFCILAAYLISTATVKWTKYIFIILLIFYSVKTISRNNAWKDDFNLYAADVKTSSKSAKSNKDLGGEYFKKSLQVSNLTLRNQLLDSAIIYLTKAEEIYPDFIEAWEALGNTYFIKDKNNFQKTIDCNKQILKINPQYKPAYDNIKIVLEHINANESYYNKVCDELYQITGDSSNVSKLRNSFMPN